MCKNKNNASVGNQGTWERGFNLKNKKSWVPANAREFIKLAATWKDKDGGLYVTKNGEFTSFLEQSISPLWESNLATALVFNSF